MPENKRRAFLFNEQRHVDNGVNEAVVPDEKPPPLHARGRTETK